jgi:hypothetical protein
MAVGWGTKEKRNILVMLRGELGHVLEVITIFLTRFELSQLSHVVSW